MCLLLSYLSKNKPKQSEEETNLPPVQPIHFVDVQRFVEMEPGMGGGESFVDQVHNVQQRGYYTTPVPLLPVQDGDGVGAVKEKARRKPI